jgi:hypothetical protein
MPYSREIRELATRAFVPPLRAMDALHPATAIAVREELGILSGYDIELCAAAQAHGLEIASPR